MWVTPALATAAMFSAVQMPPPTAIRPVTHVMSMPKVPYSAATSVREESGIQFCNPIDLPPLVSSLSCHLKSGDMRLPASGCHFILRHPLHPVRVVVRHLSRSRLRAWALRATPNGAEAFSQENPRSAFLPGLLPDTTQSSRTGISSLNNAPYRLQKSLFQP